jgi:hypothetical protein
MVHLDDGAEMLNLRVVDYGGEAVDRRERHVEPFENGCPFGLRLTR